MLTKSVVVFVLTAYFAFYFSRPKVPNPDAGLNIEELITKYGFPVERHEVITEDHFILSLHRIPHDGINTEQPRRPVLLMHGFLQSGVDFVNIGPDKALGFLLAKQGYDVWLAHVRGTAWSRKHTFLDPNADEQFWDFSLHEIGVYDTSAFIDYILDNTKQTSLLYVGFSQGTIVFYILASEKPSYNQKVGLMTNLAPAIYMNNSRNYFSKTLASSRFIIERVLHFLQIHEVFSKTGLLSQYMRLICDENSLFVEFCLFHIFSAHGFNYETVNRTLLSVLYTNMLAGSSTRQFLHLLQFADTGKFENYNFGEKLNLIKYGTHKPPSYNVSRVTTPKALYYSLNDPHIPLENVAKVVRNVPNVVKVYEIPHKAFNHIDFLSAANVVPILYNSVLDEIAKYDSNKTK